MASDRRPSRAAAPEACDAVQRLFSQAEEEDSSSDQSDVTVIHIADIHGDQSDVISDEDENAPVAEVLPQQEPQQRTQSRDKYAI